MDHRREIYDFPVPFHAVYWAEFKQEGQRLPQADHVQYLILPPDIPDAQTKQIFDAVKADFVTVYRSPYVVVMKRR
jgi:hypothetical protein